MKRLIAGLGVLALAGLLAGCGSGGNAVDVAGPSATATTSVAGERVYVATGVLVESADGSVALCQPSFALADIAVVGTATTISPPPGCDRLSIPVHGINVEALPAMVTSGDQTYTESVVTVTGTWNGTTLTSTGPVTGPNEQPVLTPEPDPDFSVPCTEPPTGWPPMASTLADYTAGIQGLKAYEADHADTFAGSWSGPDQETLVEAFTDDPSNHQADLAAIYPRVCVIRGARTLASLEAIRADLTAGKMPNGNRVLTSATELASDRASGPFVLRVTLVVDDPDVSAWLQSQYNGAVAVDGAILEPA